MKALSIRQPWAWLIVNGFKNIENRSWPTRFRGPVLIHAGIKRDEGDWREAMELLDRIMPLSLEEMRNRRAHCLNNESGRYGGIIGAAEIVDCVQSSDSPWFFGKHGFVMRNAKPLPFQPCRGRLGFFMPEVR